MSADVLLERIREQAERRGLLWMAPDVISFVITILVYGQCLETNQIHSTSQRASRIMRGRSVGSLCLLEESFGSGLAVILYGDHLFASPSGTGWHTDDLRSGLSRVPKALLC
jgi:hypothetical protein